MSSFLCSNFFGVPERVLKLTINDGVYEVFEGHTGNLWCRLVLTKESRVQRKRTAIVEFRFE